MTMATQSLTLLDSELPSPLERSMGDGETHVYTLSLAAERYLRLSVDQKGIDVALRLLEPGADAPLVSVDSPTGSQGPETLMMVTSVAGDYRLEIEAYKGQVPERYELRIEELRPAATKDHERLVPWLAFHGGEELRRQRTTVSRRQALDLYEEAREGWSTLDDVPNIAQAHGRIGWVYQDLGEYEKARVAYEEALRLLRKLGDRENEALILNRLGTVELRLEDTVTAGETFEEALRVYAALDRPMLELAVLQNIGNLHFDRNDPQAALDTYRTIRDRIHSVQDDDTRDRLLSVALYSSGLVLLYQGQTEKALVELRKALGIYRRLDDDTAIGRTLNRIGDAYQRQQQYGQAIDLLREALERSRASGAPQRLAVSLTSLANLYREIDQPDNAIELYEEALRIVRAKAWRKDEAMILVNLGLHHHRHSKPGQALAPLEKALVVFQEVGDERRAAYARYASARVLRDLGALTAARAHLEAAVETIEKLRLGYQEEDLRMSFFAGKQTFYRLWIDVLMRLEETAPNTPKDYSSLALEIDERRRARVFLDLLVTRPPKRGEEPRYADGAPPDFLSAAEMRRLLDEDSLLLVYSLGEERSFVWSVTRSAPPRGHFLPPRTEVEALVKTAYRSLVRSQPTDDALVPLGDVLLRPVAEELAGKRLVVVADGALQYLPFAVLPSPSDGAPLAVEHEIVYLPSASVLATMRQEVFDREPAPKDLAIIADPVFREDVEAGEGRLERLPGTANEAEAVASLFQDDMLHVALGADASRATVTSGMLASYRYVHFATHGVLDAKHPELGGLALSQVDEAGRPQDGFLRLREIFDLDLPAELVVLSACQTGLGAEVPGEGLVGLTRGFMYAGTPRVVVSLWKVDDESTAELMTRFYRGMLDGGLTPAAALRAAQLDLRRDKRWEHPYHWAPFVLQGEWMENTPKVTLDDDMEPPDTGADAPDPIDADIGGGPGQDRMGKA